MADDFESFNKQIAAYVVLSVALSTPAAFADPLVVAPPVLRYGGPTNPAVMIDKINVIEPPLLRYAGPPNPIMYAEPKNVVLPAADTAQYAVPQIPAVETNLHMNNMINTNNINMNNFGGIQLSPGHFIFK